MMRPPDTPGLPLLIHKIIGDQIRIKYKSLQFTFSFQFCFETEQHIVILFVAMIWHIIRVRGT